MYFAKIKDIKRKNFNDHVQVVISNTYFAYKNISRNK